MSMTKRQIHTLVEKYNEFNERFGDEQFDIEIFVPYKKEHWNKDIEFYIVDTDNELYTRRESELLKYILGEVDYLENNLSQSEGGLQEQLERPEERAAFRKAIRYLKAVCNGEYYGRK